MISRSIAVFETLTLVSYHVPSQPSHSNILKTTITVRFLSAFFPTHNGEVLITLHAMMTKQKRNDMLNAWRTLVGKYILHLSPFCRRLYLLISITNPQGQPIRVRSFLFPLSLSSSICHILLHHHTSAHAQLTPFLHFPCSNAAGNRAIHITTTGPEIHSQTSSLPGGLTAFICATGTGGTLAGVTRYLKEVSGGKIQCWLADPPGSCLEGWINRGTLVREGGSITEGKLHAIHSPWDEMRAMALISIRISSCPVFLSPLPSYLLLLLPFLSLPSFILAGIGQGRVTSNLQPDIDLLDGALLIPDSKTIAMVYSLLHDDGIYVGASSAMNVVAAKELAVKLGKGSRVVTILCDGAYRCVSPLLSCSSFIFLDWNARISHDGRLKEYCN